MEPVDGWLGSGKKLLNWLNSKLVKTEANFSKKHMYRSSFLVKFSILASIFTEKSNPLVIFQWLCLNDFAITPK